MSNIKHTYTLTHIYIYTYVYHINVDIAKAPVIYMQNFNKYLLEMYTAYYYGVYVYARKPKIVIVFVLNCCQVVCVVVSFVLI